MSRFHATGKGFANQSPNAPADANDASGIVTDLISNKSVYLYVTSVSTRWTLRGSASQTQSRRTFYPQHLVQEDVVVKGQCPNQYEYDRIVEFVEHHHHNMLGLGESARKDVFGNNTSGLSSADFRAPGGANQNINDIGVQFKLLPSTTERRWVTPPSDANGDFLTDLPSRTAFNGGFKGIHLLPPFFVSGIITQMRAGAIKGQFSPEFELGFKITHDHLGPPYEDSTDVAQALRWYRSGLGSMYKPEEVPGGGDADTTPAAGGDGSGPTLGDKVDAVKDWWDRVTESEG